MAEPQTGYIECWGCKHVIERHSATDGCRARANDCWCPRRWTPEQIAEAYKPTLGMILHPSSGPWTLADAVEDCRKDGLIRLVNRAELSEEMTDFHGCVIQQSNATSSAVLAAYYVAVREQAREDADAGRITEQERDTRILLAADLVFAA
jgi:hypothetical protein